MLDDLHGRLQTRRPDLFRKKPERYEPILADVLDRLSYRASLTRADLEFLKGTHCNSAKRPDSRKLGYLVQVLKAINAEGTYQVPIPTAPIPSVRPTLLPASFKQWWRLPTAQGQLDFLSKLTVDPTEEGSGPLLEVAMRLVGQLGVGERVAVGILAHATESRMVGDNTLWTPVHPADPFGARYRLPLPSPLGARLREWLNKSQHQPPPAVDPGTTVNSQGADADQVMKALRQELGTAFHQFNQAFEQAKGRPEPGRRIASWPSFARDGRYLALRQEIPGFFLEVVRDYPLPAEAQAFDPGQPSGSRIQRNDATPAGLPDTSGLHTPAPAGPITLFEGEGEPPEDWSCQVRNALRNFTDRADELARDGVIKQGQRQTLNDHVEWQIEHANQIAPGSSILHVALLWGFSRLVPDEGAKNRIKISSLRTEMSRLFSPALLNSPETWDLAEWDDETIEEVTARVLTTKRWGPATRQYFRETWARFLRFAQSFNIMPEVTVVAGRGNDLPGRPRSEILKPVEIDRLFGFLFGQRPANNQHRLRENWILACALVLGAYGGLRASEVLGLTLGDVLVTKDECWVDIRKGKTPSARRRVPLHLVAPPDQTSAIQEWVDKRFSEFPRGFNPSATALFGNHGQPDRYARARLIDPLIVWIREWLGPGVDFHLLRHSAASWLFARWHAAKTQDPTANDSLPYGWAFSDEGLSAAYYLLEGAMSDQGGSGDDALLRLAKFMGHQGYDTLLQHYLHTLGWVHGRTLA